jgi:hypothetical protein
MNLNARLLRGDTLHMAYDKEAGPGYWFEAPYQRVSAIAVNRDLGINMLEGLNDNLLGDTIRSQSFQLATDSALVLITESLRHQRFVISSETTLQDEIATVFQSKQFPFHREYRLAPRDRIDFLIGRIGVEVKIKGTKRGILRQLQRYAESPAIAGLILVSSVSTGLPETINGKPVHFLSLGEAWL